MPMYAPFKIAFTETESRARGDGLDITWGWQKTILGPTLFARTSKGLCFLGLVPGAGRKDAEQRLFHFFSGATFTRDDACVVDDARAVDTLWSGRKLSAPLKLDLYGTEFQLSVWRALMNIPFDGVVTYGDIASDVGRSMASRAVGNAVGANPVAVLVPCHRVLPTNGKIGNYGWGPRYKKQLLDLEKSIKIA